jgi:methyl-accepting chemotaxis protein
MQKTHQLDTFERDEDGSEKTFIPLESLEPLEPLEPLKPSESEESEQTPDSSDYLLNMLLQANQLEQTGDSEAARVLYEEIVAIDSESAWGASAKKALQALTGEDADRLDDFGHTHHWDNDDSEDSTLGLGELAAGSRDMALGEIVVPSSEQSGWDKLRVGTKFRTIAIGTALLPTLIAIPLALWPLERDLTRTHSTVAPSGQVAADEDLQSVLDRTRWKALAIGLGVALLAAWSASRLLESLSVKLRAITRFARATHHGHPAQLPVARTPDELGVLAQTLYAIAQQNRNGRDRINYLEQQLAQIEAQQQQEKERWQQQAIELLLQIEGARSGNLTANVSTVDGEIGAIADAFNATIGSLRRLVTQVKTVTGTVNQRVTHNEVSVRAFSVAALTQSEELKSALASVVDITESIGRISQSTQEAAAIAHTATEAAQAGDRAMEQTVVTMDKIRTGVANTAKKAKRLAESAQEISQILEIVTTISEKANLLAFNAAIEAARAGEQGQGFRQVADEVRGLAQQVSDSAQDIEQLIDSIQEETATVVRVLEVSTGEVVNGTQLVNQTKQTLQRLTQLSQQIDRYLQDVATHTVDQAVASKQVNQTMASVAQISMSTANEAQGVVGSLQELISDVEALQQSVAQFQVND